MTFTFPTTPAPTNYSGQLGPITPATHKIRMAGVGLTDFLRNPAVLAGIPLGAGILGAGAQFTDTNDNAAGNAADAVGNLGGSVLGGLATGAGIKALGAAIPPAGPWGAALKAALLLGGSALGGSVGGPIARGVTDAVTGGATGNSPEDRLFRTQNRQFDQTLNQKVREIQALLPMQRQQFLQAYELDELARKAEFERQTAAGLQNNLWQGALASSARSSDMMANALNSVLNV